MVEDNLQTLHKIQSSNSIRNQVLPVLASWGYNTTAQQDEARSRHYVVLEEDSSLATVLDDQVVEKELEEFVAKQNCNP